MRNYLEYLKNVPDIREQYELFNKEAKAASSVLYNEFHRKKKAFEIGNIRHRNTGNLDVKKLHEVRINENIFEKKKYFEKGKNHAFYMLLDWSQSFEGSFRNSVKQTIILCDFSRAINARFIVKAIKMKTGMRALWEPTFNEKGVQQIANSKWSGENFLDLNLLDSTQADYETSRFLLWLVGTIKGQVKGESNITLPWEQGEYREARSRLNHILTNVLSLSGTPLNESLISMRNLMMKERSPNLIQNLIIMTDGAGTHLRTKNDFNVTDWSMECPFTRKVYTGDKELWDSLNLHSMRYGMMTPKMGSIHTHFLLRTFDWPGVNKYWFFIQPSERKWKEGSYLALFPSTNIRNNSGIMKGLIEPNMDSGVPTIVENYGMIDKLIMVPASYFSQPKVKDKVWKAAHKIVEQFDAEQRKLKNLQYLSKVLSEYITIDYARNKDFIRKMQCEYIDFLQAVKA